MIYAAKRFFRLSNAPNNPHVHIAPFTVGEHYTPIRQELKRLALGSHLLKAFFEEAGRLGVHVEEGMFSYCCLV